MAVGIQNTMDYGGNSFQLFSFQTHGLNIRDRAKTDSSGLYSQGLRRLRQEDCEFKARLINGVRSVSK